MVRSHEDLQGGRVGHAGQQLSQVRFWQQAFPIAQNLRREQKQVSVHACAVQYAFLILSLGAPDGCGNHYTGLHHQDVSAMSAERSLSGRQKRGGKQMPEGRRKGRICLTKEQEEEKQG